MFVLRRFSRLDCCLSPKVSRRGLIAASLSLRVRVSEFEPLESSRVHNIGRPAELLSPRLVANAIDRPPKPLDGVLSLAGARPAKPLRRVCSSVSSGLAGSGELELELELEHNYKRRVSSSPRLRLRPQLRLSALGSRLSALGCLAFCFLLAARSWRERQRQLNSQ